MNSLSNTSSITLESVLAALHESNRILTEKFAESDRQRKENERILNEQFAESDRQRKENERILNEKFAETDRMIKETRESIKEVSRQMGGMANSNGSVAETYFISSFTKNPFFAGQEFDNIDPNVSRKNKQLNLKAEFDLVMYNGSSVAIIEIKYKAGKEDIEPLLKKPQTFRQLFPVYSNYKIYLGLAGLSIDKDAEKKAIEQGIAVIKQMGDDLVIEDEHLKVF